MALRLPIKINRNFIQNLGKVFYSGKATTKPVRNLNEANVDKTATKDGNIPKNSIYGTHLSSLTQQVKISSEQKVSEADIVQTNMERNHLQPSKLAEYYKPPADINNSGYLKLEDSQVEQGTSQYRPFEKSTTYKNVKLPLKKPKLVSPFPDPVKVMPSDTMSDLEKADLKEAEARCGKTDTKMSVNFTQCRYYSKKCKKPSKKKSGEDKCKKLGKKKKMCPAAKNPCKQGAAKKKICDNKYKFKPCKKKKAPYQAYSEFCHTIPDEKPSECKMCPWKPSEHPTFTPPKKKFHTSSITFCPRKRLREKQRLKADLKRGWVTQEEWSITVEESNCERHLNSLLCKKNPCKPPKDPCKSSKKKHKKSKKGKKSKKEKKEKGHKSKKHKKSKKKPKKKAATVNSNRSWVTLTDPESINEFPTLFNHRTVPYFFKNKKGDKGKPLGNFKKFPFRGCNIKKPKKEEDTTRKCRKTKIRNKRKVKDCPPETCNKRSSAPTVLPLIEYSLAKSKKPKCPKPNKCVKISPGKCQNEPDDPCGKIRKGTTKECPTDLLKKKRRKPIKPKKKTQNIITPLSDQQTSPPSTSS